MAIWSDSFLNQLALDAEEQINTDLQAIYYKFCMATVVGVSVYTLPAFVRSVLRITWLGRKLDPVSWEELTLLTPATVFVGQGNPDNIETSNSRPLYYAMHPTNPYDIRFYPSPNLSFTTSGDNPWGPTVNGPACIVSCWRNIDETFQANEIVTSGDPTLCLPRYIDRRTRKAYILWKAFSAEGKGQNLVAAGFYKQKYEFLIEQFRLINEGCFVGKKYCIEDGELAVDKFRYPKPILPANFESVRF